MYQDEVRLVDHCDITIYTHLANEALEVVQIISKHRQFRSVSNALVNPVIRLYMCMVT